MDGDDLRDDLHNELNRILQKVESGIVTKWVLLSETIDAEGARGLWCFCNEGATAWDTLGLLMFALQREQAKIRED
jgi:hypothetical protein